MTEETRTIEDDLPESRVNIPAEVMERIKSVDDFIRATSITVIEDQTTYDQVNEIRKHITATEKDLEEKQKTITRPMDESKRRVMDLFRIPRDKLSKLKQGLLRMQGSYQEKKRQQELEEQRKRDEEAARERARIQAEADRKRIEEEKARQAAEDARRKAQAEQDAAARAKLEAEAKKQEAKADAAADSADIKIQMATEIHAPKVTPKVEKGGVYQVTTYEPEVKDKKAFVAWALNSGMLEYLDVNLALLKKEAQATKGQRSWPGIRVTTHADTRGRGK